MVLVDLLGERWWLTGAALGLKFEASGGKRVGGQQILQASSLLRASLKGIWMTDDAFLTC